MKHGCSTRGVAPASDAAGRGDAQGTPLPTRLAVSHCVVPCGFHVLFADSRRHKPTRLQLGPIRSESGRLRPKSAETADSGRNLKKKKKKGAERTVWLISKPYFSPISHKRQNISSFPHISSLTSLVSASLPLFRLPCGYETLSHLALTQFTASIHSFFSSLSRILNSGIIIKLSILV